MQMGNGLNERKCGAEMVREREKISRLMLQNVLNQQIN